MKVEHLSGHYKTGLQKDVFTNAKLAVHILKEIHAQISGVLAGAKFPVNTPADLISASPNRTSIKCYSGNPNLAANKAGKLLMVTGFPFANVEAVDDLIVNRASL